jgi:hypothetical protein
VNIHRLRVGAKSAAAEEEEALGEEEEEASHEADEDEDNDEAEEGKIQSEFDCADTRYWHANRGFWRNLVA